MRKFLFRRKISNAHTLFKEHYVDAKTLYVFEMDEVPCIGFIGELDANRAFAYIRETFGADIKHTYQHTYYDHESRSTYFNNTIFVMANARMLELGSNYCHVLHSTDDHEWARRMLTALSDFRIAAASPQTQVMGFARQAQMN